MFTELNKILTFDEGFTKIISLVKFLGKNLYKVLLSILYTISYFLMAVFSLFIIIYHSVVLFVYWFQDTVNKLAKDLVD